jgi:uncharacterized protein YifE (UPF0438 family)
MRKNAEATPAGKQSSVAKEEDSRAPPDSVEVSSEIASGGLAADVESTSEQTEGQSYGLGGANPQRLLREYDARAVAELRVQLNELKTSVWTFERAEIIALLKILGEFLDDLLDERAYVQHAAVGLLDRFIEVLEDLDRGKVHPGLKQNVVMQAGRALRADQRRRDEVWLQTVDIIQREKKFTTRLEAERYFVKSCQKTGLTRDGEKVTVQMLKSLRNHPKKSLAK